LREKERPTFQKKIRQARPAKAKHSYSCHKQQVPGHGLDRESGEQNKNLVTAHPGIGIACGARASAMAWRTVLPVCLAVLAMVRKAA
jgi:hypothetical protein